MLDSDWYDARINYAGADDDLLAEKRAAQLADDHAGTPTVVHLDVLGRSFLSIADNANSEYFETKSVLDIQGNVLQVIDARTNVAEERVYGMLGQSLEVDSHDAGDRQILLNALGQPMRTWDSRNQCFSHTYDTLRRPVDQTVSVSGGSEILLGRIVYGDLLSSPEDTNHIGRVYRVYDGAGVATTVEFDFKGNALEEQRQLVADQTSQPDWSDLLGQSTIAAMASAVASLLDSETFSASSQRDALNRVLVAISPDDSQVLYTYDEGGALQQVEVKHRGSSTAQTVVGDITYNARGQRESVTYGSTSSPTTVTSYEYDPETFRLFRLTTDRDSDSATLQDLYYHYDPVGNVTDIRDEAQQTVYFQNSVVDAANSYTYDAVYRLIEATGREHSTQGTTQRTDVQISVGPQPMTSDPSAMRRYTQTYTYDEVGNILTMVHAPASGTGWTRYYVYDADGNQLDQTSAPGDDPQGPYSHSYSYDAHGNMTAMPHLSSMVWNHVDELQEVTVGSETVYLQYAGGQRSRKYVEKTGTTTEERIYLGSFEIYRKRINGDIDTERESLHISDGTGRICIIETKTIDGGSAVSSPTGIWRYQLSNHLGSATVEVDENGGIISYEEYHPYGTSAYRAVDSSIDVSAKRYRYTGMERDEETSLEYHSARYYAPWLGRWMASDPIGLKGGGNRFAYCGGDPAGRSDQNGYGWLTELATQTREAEDRAEAPEFYGEVPIPSSLPAGTSRIDNFPVHEVEGSVPFTNAIQVDPAKLERAAAERENRAARSNAILEQRPMSSMGFTGMAVWSGVLTLPISASFAWVGGATGVGAFFAAETVYVADQTVAGTRRLAGNHNAQSALHFTAKHASFALGAEEETAESIATGTEITLGAAFLVGDFAVPMPQVSRGPRTVQGYRSQPRNLLTVDHAGNVTVERPRGRARQGVTVHIGLTAIEPGGG